MSTVIRSTATEGTRELDVIVRNDGRVNLSIHGGASIQIFTADLLAALDAVPREERDKASFDAGYAAGRADYDALAAVVERVREAMHEAYVVRGDRYTWNGANALKAALESALDPKPALPTEPGSIIIATEVKGHAGKWTMMNAGDDQWWSAAKIVASNGWLYDSVDITAWRPAKVVAA